jgi:hypothetical protein
VLGAPTYNWVPGRALCVVEQRTSFAMTPGGQAVHSTERNEARWDVLSTERQVARVRITRQPAERVFHGGSAPQRTGAPPGPDASPMDAWSFFAARQPIELRVTGAGAVLSVRVPGHFADARAAYERWAASIEGEQGWTPKAEIARALEPQTWQFRLPEWPAGGGPTRYQEGSAASLMGGRIWTERTVVDHGGGRFTWREDAELYGSMALALVVGPTEQSRVGGWTVDPAGHPATQWMRLAVRSHVRMPAPEDDPEGRRVIFGEMAFDSHIQRLWRVCGQE